MEELIEVTLIELKDITKDTELPVGVLIDGKLIGILSDAMEPDDIPF